MPNDPWASQPPGPPLRPREYSDARGSLDGRQRKLIMARLGRMERGGRIAKIRTLTGDESIESTNDLSEAQAADVIRQLEES